MRRLHESASLRRIWKIIRQALKAYTFFKEPLDEILGSKLPLQNKVKAPQPVCLELQAPEI